MRRLVAFLVFIGFCSICFAGEGDKLIEQAYKIKKNLSEFEKMDKAALGAKSDEETGDIYEKMAKFLEKNVDKEVEMLKGMIEKFVKKSGYVKFEKLVEKINPEIKKIIYDTEADNFHYSKYVNTPFYTMTNQMMDSLKMMNSLQ